MTFGFVPAAHSARSFQEYKRQCVHGTTVKPIVVSVILSLSCYRSDTKLTARSLDLLLPLSDVKSPTCSLNVVGSLYAV